MKSSFIITPSEARACYEKTDSQVSTEQAPDRLTFSSLHSPPSLRSSKDNTRSVKRSSRRGSSTKGTRWKPSWRREGCLVPGGHDFEILNGDANRSPARSADGIKRSSFARKEERRGVNHSSRFPFRRTEEFCENKTNRSGLNSKTRKTIRLSRHLRNFTMSNVVLLGISLITLSFESKSVYREEFIRPVVRVSLQFCYPQYFHCWRRNRVGLGGKL